MSIHLQHSRLAENMFAPGFVHGTHAWLEQVLRVHVSYRAAIYLFYTLPILALLPSNALLLCGVLSGRRSYFIAAYVALVLFSPLLVHFVLAQQPQPQSETQSV